MNFDDLTPLAPTAPSFMGEFSSSAPVEAAPKKSLDLPPQEEPSEQAEPPAQKKRAKQSKSSTKKERSQSLSPEEQSERDRLEEKIDYIQKQYSNLDSQCSNLHLRLGEQLDPIRKRKLHRSTHGTRFHDYCKDRHGISSRHADNCIQLFNIKNNVEEMSIVHSQNHPDETSNIILPTNLEQTKALGKFKSPEMQWEVWKKSVEAANGKSPSGSLVEKIIKEYFSEPIPKDWQVGDVFVLKKLKDEEKKYNGSYCFAKELKDGIVTVETQNSTLTVNSDYLNKIDLPNAKQQVQQTWDRLKRIQENVELLEPKVAEFVERIGKQITLSPLVEDMLSCIEKHCEVTESENNL